VGKIPGKFLKRLSSRNNNIIEPMPRNCTNSLFCNFLRVNLLRKPDSDWRRGRRKRLKGKSRVTGTVRSRVPDQRRSDTYILIV
jgi:hypothetical protein